MFWTFDRRAIAPMVLFAALTLGGALGARAEGWEDRPVSGESCELLAGQVVSGTCPRSQIPEREEPWLPVIALPDPASTPNCEQLIVVVDNIAVSYCPHVGGRPMSIGFEAPVPLAEAVAVTTVPDYGGPSDILPFQLCFGRENWPTSIALYGPSDNEFVTRASVRAYCCAACGRSADAP